MSYSLLGCLNAGATATELPVRPRPGFTVLGFPDPGRLSCPRIHRHQPLPQRLDVVVHEVIKIDHQVNTVVLPQSTLHQHLQEGVAGQHAFRPLGGVPTCRTAIVALHEPEALQSHFQQCDFQG